MKEKEETVSLSWKV